MHSESVNAALARTLISIQFPKWSGLEIEPVANGGIDHFSFRLGSRMLIRLPSAVCYATQVLKDHEWLPRLAPHLPLKIPRPLALGVPSTRFPHHFSVYEWIEGAPAGPDNVVNRANFAVDLANFLQALQSQDLAGAPRPGGGNFYRGGDLSTYDDETRIALRQLNDGIDKRAAKTIWQKALSSEWNGDMRFVHGDIAPGNLLVRDGRLVAIIDFGLLAAGDPACDYAICWTFLDDTARLAFRRALEIDDATWARAKGWALWKALITLARSTMQPEAITAAAAATLATLLDMHD